MARIRPGFRLRRGQNLADLTDPTAARGSLGLGSAAVQDDTRYAHRANNLGDLGNAGTARNNLGLGSVATMGAGQFLRSDQGNDYIDLANHEMDTYSEDGRLFFDSSAGCYVPAINASHNGPALLWSSANFTAGNGLSVSYDNEDKPTLDIANGGVDTLQIKNNAVVSDKIKDGAVNAGKLGTGQSIADWVRDRMADHNVGEIGTYAMLERTDSYSSTSAGNVVSGSNLAYSGAGGSSGGSPNGSWQCMGRTENNTGDGSNHVAIWLRIS